MEESNVWQRRTLTQAIASTLGVAGLGTHDGSQAQSVVSCAQSCVVHGQPANIGIGMRTLDGLRCRCPPSCPAAWRP